MPLRLCALPALFLLLSPELDGLLPAKFEAPLEQRHRLIRQQFPNRYLQLLTPAVPAAGPEVEDMAPVTDPAPMGRQRWPVAGSTAQATSCAQPRWRCRSSVQPLQRWVVPIGEGPFGKVRSCAGRRPRRQLWSVSPGARAERVRRCRTLALGWVGFFAAAGGCGIRIWIARRPARGCGGLDRLWDRGGGRWLAGVPRCGRVLLDAWLAPSLSPVNLEPCCSSSQPRLMPRRRPAGRRFMPPVLCCQVPQSRLTASALTLPIVRLY
jgi:hypothetical protein